MTKARGSAKATNLPCSDTLLFFLFLRWVCPPTGQPVRGVLNDNDAGQCAVLHLAGQLELTRPNGQADLEKLPVPAGMGEGNRGIAVQSVQAAAQFASLQGLQGEQVFHGPGGQDHGNAVGSSHHSPRAQTRRQTCGFAGAIRGLSHSEISVDRSLFKHSLIFHKPQVKCKKFGNCMSFMNRL